MTYTGASLILGVGKATAAQIDKFFELRGRALAPRYAPDKQYQPAPAGLGQMIINAARLWRQSVNHDLLAAQIVKEAAAWQSEYSRHRNNPSGLGAINSDPDQAIHFATPQEGIRATVAHLLTYVSGPGPWTEHDPRAAATPASWQGSVRRLSDLDGKWAFPGNGYGSSIASIANEILKVEVDDMPTGLKPPMIDYPSPNKNGYDASDGMTNPRTIEAICCHIGTSTKASNLNWLTKPASYASCNAYVDKQGQIYELVPKASAAWTAGRVNKPDLSNPIIKRWIDNGWNPNTRLYNIEHEGEPGDDLTDAQIASTSRIIAWVASEEDFPIDREHVIGHYQIDSVNRSHCPSFSDAEWQRLIDGAKAITNGTGPMDETAREINGYTVRGAFLAAYQQLELDGAHWWTFGLPTGADVPGVLVDGSERTVQPFDRAGWVMTEGGGVVIAKPGQAKQINAALGIETGADVRVSAVREAARAARDQIDVILSEVAD